jgi:DNA modification methylase
MQMTGPILYKRKEIIGDCTLYLGDCREVLTTLGKVDAVVTDPPYGLGESNTKKHMSRGQLALTRLYPVLNDWDSKPITASDIDLLRQAGKWQIIFGGNYFELPPAKCWLVWDKLNGDNDFADCELAWTNLNKAVRRISFLWNGMLRAEKGPRVHSTQKPVAVMEWCIKHAPADVETILDPYMGSGTTGVACVKLGRKFIGIEREPTYFDIACERIRKAYAQPDMFISSPTPKATQETML